MFGATARQGKSRGVRLARRHCRRRQRGGDLRALARCGRRLGGHQRAGTRPRRRRFTRVGRGVDRWLFLAHQPPACVEIAHRLPTRRSGSPSRAQPTLTWPGWCPGLSRRVAVAGTAAGNGATALLMAGRTCRAAWRCSAAGTASAPAVETPAPVRITSHVRVAPVGGWVVLAVSQRPVPGTPAAYGAQPPPSRWR
jgi:hypothetical protein